MSATGTNSPKMTYAAYKARAKRREIIHPLVTDQTAMQRYVVAKNELNQARGRNAKPDLIAHLEAEVEAADAAARESTILFRLRAMAREGDNSFAVLKAEHPPTKEDHEQAQADSGNPKAKADWNVKTFGPALVAACLAEPEVTVEQAKEMSVDLNEAEWGALVNAAIAVNTQATQTADLVFS